MGFAQGEYNNWYFGINCGVSFTDTGLRVITDSKMYSVEGCASISDSDGNLMFYVGTYIRDRNNNRMPNDTGYIADLTTQQSCLIVPKPDDASIYYCILNNNNAVWGAPRALRIFVIDMKMNGGLGDLVSLNDTLMTNTTEQLTATLHRNGKDIWIVSHSFATNEFYSFLVTKNGINRTPVISATGISPDNKIYAYTGTIKISSNGCWLAATIREAYKGSGALQLLHFDNRTGKVTGNGYKKVYGPYGIEFSADSKKLYLGSNGQGTIKQFDLNSSTDSTILANGIDCSDTFFCTFDFQLAPNGKIYFPCAGMDFLVNRSPNDPYLHYLGVINEPNQSGRACFAKIDSAHFYPNVKCNVPNNFNLNSTTYKSCKNCTNIVTAQITQSICDGDSMKFGSRYLKSAGVYQGDTVTNYVQCDSTTLLNLQVRKLGSAASYSICQGDTLKFIDSAYYKSGQYHYKLRSFQGCDSLLSLTVKVNPLPSIAKFRDSIICKLQTLTYDLSSYRLKEIRVNGNLSSPIFLSSEDSVYIFQWLDSNDCSNSDTLKLKQIVCDTHFKIGNAFTPGSDGLNDYFDIDIKGESHYKLEIYNRWGILVFKQNKDNDQPDENWNGRYLNQGNICPDGTYYYLFEYAFNGKSVKTMNGSIQLIH